MVAMWWPLIAVLGVVALAGALLAQMRRRYRAQVRVIRAVRSGAWADPDTWGGSVPKPGDAVVIPEGVEVIL
jgi:hypothetical protein